MPYLNLYCCYFVLFLSFLVLWWFGCFLLFKKNNNLNCGTRSHSTKFYWVMSTWWYNVASATGLIELLKHRRGYRRQLTVWSARLILHSHPARWILNFAHILRMVPPLHFVKIVFVITWKLIKYIKVYIFRKEISQRIYLNSQNFG